MEHSPETVVIHILTDSRGAGLQRLLSQEDCELDFQVTVKSGATFQQLADLAKRNKDNFAYQIVAGGICSLTLKTGKYIHYTRNITKLTKLKANISDTLATLGTRVTIATVPQAHLAKYNSHHSHPDREEISLQAGQADQQQLLNEDLRELNTYIEEKNALLGSPQVHLEKASCANSVERRGKNKTKRDIHRGFTYTRLYDGVH